MQRGTNIATRMKKEVLILFAGAALHIGMQSRVIGRIGCGTNPGGEISMQPADFEQIAAIRAAVGYLGEKDQAGWWSSSFFAATGWAFLSPVFARTQVVAQCQGVSGAASKIHDERIGVGNVYHLFRLPEDIEQAIHRILHQADVAQRIKQYAASPEAAVQLLSGGGAAPIDGAVGPTRVAEVAGLRELQTWRLVAATYADGFQRHTEIYPYFSDRK